MTIARYIPLAHDVLVVATVNFDVMHYTAYIGAVPGQNHSKECERVAAEGDKISREMAELLFPEFAEKYAWRD